MTWIDPRRAKELTKSLRERTGRTSEREETSVEGSELPKGKVVGSSTEDVELAAVEESCKSPWTSGTAPEHELQDGTNLPTGTNYVWQSRKSDRWFDPFAVVENPNWRQTLQRLSERMKAFQLQGKRFPVCLKQTQTPRLGGTIEAHVHSSSGYSFCSGLGLEPVFVEPQVAVVPSFAFPDANGRPIANSVGEPYPFRAGFSRTHYVERASGEDLQLFSDAAKVLSVLPVFVNEILWKRWRQGFPLPEDGFDEGVWIDAVFETSWQRLPFSSLRASRKGRSESGTSSAVLKGEGLFPRIPPAFRSMVPNFHGYPQRIHSELDDLLEASIQLIDTILAIPENRSVDPRNLQFDKEHCEDCPTTPEQRELIDLIASGKNQLSTEDERLKAFKKGTVETLIANRFIVQQGDFFECTPNGLHLFIIKTDQLVEETLAMGREHLGDKRKQPSQSEVPVVTIETVCDRMCSQQNGRKTLKKILEQSKRGLQPSEIARQNSARGFSLSNISEKLTEVRDKFPGFLPE